MPVLYVISWNLIPISAWLAHASSAMIAEAQSSTPVSLDIGSSVVVQTAYLVGRDDRRGDQLIIVAKIEGGLKGDGF